MTAKTRPAGTARSGHRIWRATWALTGAGFPWFVFPLLGWGTGLAGHALAVSGSLRASDDERAAR